MTLSRTSSLFLSSARSRAELDRDYSPSLFVESLPALIEDWARRTALAKARHAGRLRPDLAYGPHPRERIDYFRAAEPSGALLVYLHGGFWQHVSKEESGFLAPGWLEAGVDVAVMDYALAPEVTLPAIVAQARRGLSWLLTQAGALGFDPERVVVAGHSAGAHLAAMTQLGTAVPLRGLALLSGVFELEPVRRSYVNEAVGMDEAAVAALSPARQDPARPLPLLVAVGERESVAFQEQSRLLAWNWREAGCPVEWRLLPHHTHFSLLDDAGDPSSPLGRGIAELLGLGENR